jgi:hypothetical protein
MIGEERRVKKRRENYVKAGDDGVLCRDWRREITTQ